MVKAYVDKYKYSRKGSQKKTLEEPVSTEKNIGWSGERCRGHSQDICKVQFQLVPLTEDRTQLWLKFGFDKIIFFNIGYNVLFKINTSSALQLLYPFLPPSQYKQVQGKVKGSRNVHFYQDCVAVWVLKVYSVLIRTVECIN